MKAIEPGQKGMWVGFNVFIILLKDAPEELVFGMMNGLDDEPIISGEVKEGSGFPGTAEFGEDIFRGE